MARVARGALFVGLLAVAGLAMLMLVPGLKEGVSQEEVPGLFGGVGLFLLLGLVWWLASGRALGLSLAGWVVLAVPTVAYLVEAGLLIAADLEGRRLAEEVAIEGYREEAILWPGFDGPVGLALSFDLVHPEGVSGLILPPEIRMGPALEIPRDRLVSSRTNGSGYFKDTYLEQPVGALTLLKSVLFQRLYENDSFQRDYEKWVSAFHFAPGARTRLTFHLHPGALDYLESPARLCLSSRTFGQRVCEAGEDPADGCASPNRRPVSEPIYADGGDLSALWVAVGGYDMVVDLGPVLTATLRAESRLQGDHAAWTRMQKRLERTGLAAAGYRLCPPGEDSHNAFRTCYCRPTGA
ncbi:MAG: hypothetical protein R3322_06855 [Kiloniellales bacterium]|nr:hypothetical protein [Kiloniellales bacterium]